MKIRNLIKITGIVQGVGFRPFVYNSALSLKLVGWVNNSSEGVTIDIEGEASSISEFFSKLHKTPPPLSRIQSIEYKNLPLKNYIAFSIKFSDSSNNKTTLISPDICTCDQCFNDVFDTTNKRYMYPFTNCTNCGPRFSIIKALPYDRISSTMNEFTMCPTCSDEYSNPSNRRFHAQPNACDICGPVVWLEDSKGLKLSSVNVLKDTCTLLEQGKILAIKGIGGFNLVCDAFNTKAVDSLRKRKNRPHKPFALMIDSQTLISNIFTPSDIEIEFLNSKERPIVVLSSEKPTPFSKNISPGIESCGIMRPYTPLHKLLFSGKITALIMTSGNLSGLPLEYTNSGARNNLNTIADFFLMHDREIFSPIDDSVVKIVDEIPVFIRRARGYVPIPLNINISDGLLSLGGDMKNTFSFSKGNNIFMSQYNGNLSSLENISNYHRNLHNFKSIYELAPKHIVCDLHKGYYTSQFAGSLSLKKDITVSTIQHHHAHALSCMAENNLLEEKILSIIFDGTGLGDDGAIWGGEFLLTDLNSSQRLSHIQNMLIVGGETAPRYPYKIALSYLSQLSAWDSPLSKSCVDQTIKDICLRMDVSQDSFNALAHCCEHEVNTFTTSSAGRLFDCVSSMIGLCDISSYEGQAAMELENLIPKCRFHDDSCYNEVIDFIDDYHSIHVLTLLNSICIDLLQKETPENISLKFHNTLVFSMVKICNILRKINPSEDIKKICLSGGVFQNSFILSKVVTLLNADSFSVFTHKDYPCNDGGLSLGQIVYSNQLILNGGIVDE